MGKANKLYRGIGQEKKKTLDEFICFQVPGATEHTESSVRGRLAASSAACCSVGFVFMFFVPVLDRSAKPWNKNHTMDLLKAGLGQFRPPQFGCWMAECLRSQTFASALCNANELSSDFLLHIAMLVFFLV